MMRDVYLRCGQFAVTFEWYPVWIGWSLSKWSYGGRSSWWHGAARLGRVKIIW